jgi:chloramphenicol-sensitive protein RarD
MTAQPETDSQRNLKSGLGYGFSAYLIWGSFPIVIRSLGFASPFEVVVWRILFGMLLAVILLTATKAWPATIAVLKDKRKVGLLALCSGLIFINWQVYVIGIASGHIVESSLGYFINPLVTIVLAVFFQKERLSPWQWTAVGLGALAVTVLTVDYGHLPLIALSLAISFGFYGLVKSRIGGSISPLIGYSVETGFLVPVAVVQGIVVASTGGLAIGTQGTWSWLGLLLFGFFTAIPLIMFGSAAKYLPLSWIGFMQYMTPTIQFITALTLFHEAMSPVRWVGFGIVWVGLAVLSIGMIRKR